MHDGLKKNKGFTLLELIVTVGIISILLSVSIPAAHLMQKSLQFMKMNSVAKEIYISSQNRLTHLKASGQLGSSAGETNGFEKCFESYGSQSSRNVNDAFGRKPGDYTSEDAGWQDLYYLKTDDSGLVSYALPDSAVSQLAGELGTYIIEVNPESGDVYSVYYTEYQTSDDLLDIYMNDVYDNRSKSDRKDYLIGYYSGNDAGSGSIPKGFEPKLTVYNGEELYLRMECKDMLKYATTFNHITVKITLTDEHGGTKVFSSESSSSGLSGLQENTGSKLKFELNGDVGTADLLLDSMESGKSFSEITGLYPGDTITAKASIVYTYHGKVVSTSAEMEQAGSTTFSSLFANGTDISDGLIQVNRVRHLNNLRESTFTIDTDMIGNGDADAGSTSETADKKIKVEQTDDIDFDADTWADEEWMETPADKTNPLSTFRPISNTVLFGGAASDAGEQKGIASINGNKNKISNFNIGSSTAPADNTGLFAEINCDVSGVRLESPAVYGSENTGSLAGAVYGGSITECGVYLKTSGDQSKMDTAVKERIVSGTDNTGGLVGKLSGGRLTSSFAAINVNKGSSTGSCTGGLAGRTSSAVIRDCYSSGDVSGRTYAGGLIGYAAGTDVSGCYSTSDVGFSDSGSTSSEYSGGFIGYITSGTVSGCSSYGKITGSKSNCGAFTSGSSSATFTGNRYLYQNNYNEGFSDGSKGGIAGAAYSDFRALGNSAQNSHPYDLSLTVFPFEFIKDIGDHYGNWPPETSMDTALIYYECYKDSSGSKTYGYYAKGYNKSESGTTSGWTLDTLKSQDALDKAGMYVFEDGYAVMSVYDLTKISYRLNSASSWTSITRSQDDRDPDNSTVSDFEQLENPEELRFTEDDGKYFTANYLYIYRLPFDLQMTSRNKNTNFYDKIELTGYAAGNTSESVFSDYTYYYNPHFAKNAIQMYDESTGESYYPDDPAKVWVRSARQLNALGRYVYYWNEDNFAKAITFTFEQEIDLDFGKYTKKYCGETFNLMDTSSSNTYKNLPIGETHVTDRTDSAGVSYKPSGFSNIYDGNCHKIIDYCQETETSEDYRFCGLFGEVKDATIRNVRMIASDPEKESGYIICKFANGSKGTGAVGALAGITYVENKDVIVSNCSASGYTIRYELGTSNLEANAAAGGLIGINMGTTSNSSAVSRLVTIKAGRAGNFEAGIGGFAGGKLAGTITNCYSGGTLQADVTGKVRIAGICTGVESWYDSRYITPDGGTASKCYSYATVDSAPSGASVYGISPKASGSYYMSSGFAVTPTSVSGATGLTYAGLCSQNIGSFKVNGAAADTSYPWTADLKSKAYPFPAIVKDGDEYAHYGDWPEGDREVPVTPDVPDKNIVTSGTFGIAKAYKSRSKGQTITTITYTYYTYDNEGNLQKTENTTTAPDGAKLPSTDSIGSNKTRYCCFWINLDADAVWKYTTGTGTPGTSMSDTGSRNNWSSSYSSATFRVTKSGSGSAAEYDSGNLTVSGN